MRAASRAWIGRAIALTGTVTALVAPTALHAGIPSRSQARPQSRIALSVDPAWTFEPNVADAAFGYVVTVAGDVNGDGYSDVLVSAPRQSVPQGLGGRVYVFHGSAAGLGAVPSWTAEALAADAQFGAAAAPAGDVNGDGYADVIIGAWKWSNGEHEEGMARVYLGSPTGLGAAPAWSFESNQADAWAGIAVAGAGDVDGDGYGDVIVGASNAGARPTGEGAAFVFRGSANGPEAAPTWTLANAQVGSRFGEAVCTAGDVNGDGFSDVIVGAKYFTNGETQEGAAYVFHGSGAGLALAPAWTEEADQLQAYLGTSVRTAGDVNGDGYSDVILGASQWDAGGFFDPGHAQVHLGGPAGLAAAPSWFHDGTGHASFYGSSVSTAGDVNHDGFADVIVGGFRHVGFTGIAQVFLGSPAGLALNPVWDELGGPGGTQFGCSVGTAGDVNGDGYAEVVVGAQWLSNPEVREGGVYLYLGEPIGLAADPDFTISEPEDVYRASIASAGDVNGDGFSDLLLGIVEQGSSGRVECRHGSPTGISAQGNWTRGGSFLGQDLGSLVAAAGDVNGDGYGDVLFSEASDAPNSSTRGVYLNLGSISGLVVVPSWSGTGFESVGSVAGAGDVNGDGYADVIVSDPSYGDDEQGAVYLWYGSATGIGDNCGPCTPEDADWFKAGTEPHQRFGHSAASAGDVNGDGFSDIVIGQDYNIIIADGAPGTVWVFMGSPSGPDTEASWTATGEQDVFSLLPPTGSAGDVNGDGYSDIFVRAFDDPVGSRPRRVLLWYGSAQGLGDPGTRANADAILESAEEVTAFGHRTAGAGDINGDGIADLAITDPAAELYGPIQVFLGSPSGIELTPSWISGDDALTWTTAVGAGDLNGDGLADLASVNYENDDSGLEARVWYGGGRRPTLRPRQRRIAEDVSIAPLGLSDDTRDVRLSAFARSAFGRTRARIEWELDPLGTLFDGGGVGVGSYFDTDLGGAEGEGIASRLTAAPMQHWRLRVRFDPARTPYAPVSRWFTAPLGGWNESMLRFYPGVASVEDRAGTNDGGIALHLAPHPARAGSRLEFELPRAARVDLALFDLTGRRRLRLAAGAFEAGRHELRWSGRDAEGRSLEPGLYFLQLALDGREAAARKVAVLR